MDNEYYLRKCSLLLVEGEKALDLSEMHITFETHQNDEESPNTARIRVHNLAPDLVKRIKGEYSRVVLQAGYQSAPFGVIFDGTIKQWYEGRESNKVDTFLDILAADGEIAYNFAMLNTSLAAGSTPDQRLAAGIAEMKKLGIRVGNIVSGEGTGGVLPRGKVLFGLARAHIRAEVENTGRTWTILNGNLYVTKFDEYRPGEAVVLSSQTGLIGRPQQTDNGVVARCLINPRIGVGRIVQIDNNHINQTSQQLKSVIAGAQVPFNKWAGITRLANIATDGIYRVYVIETLGDTRATPWYMDLVLLAIDPVTKKVRQSGG